MPCKFPPGDCGKAGSRVSLERGGKPTRAKSGKPVLSVNPQFTSQECSACHHISKANRDGEKFICEHCGHIDHADTQASRTILRRANLKFVSKDTKNLPGDSFESYACQR
ncbi:zinc ribbon domain-containing protein [Aphanizomenon sp. PH219]|nr:zinc ribbon domain-containing protein [Aphanizomenon sp. PH219]